MSQDFSDKSHDNPANIISNIPNDANTIVSYVNSVCPGWIIKSGSQFSKDLHKFNLQWAKGCITLKCSPQKVLLVSDTFMNYHSTTYKVIKELIQKLTTLGYVVMDTHNFSTCSSCGEIIVARKRLEDKGLVWSGKCQECFPYDPRIPLKE